MLKSIHITNYYHRDSGGISTSYNKLLEAAERHRRFVRLIVPGEIDRTEDVNEFARIHFIKASYSPVFDKRYRILMPWRAYIFDQAPIKKILRDEAPDIIEIGEKYTLSLMAGLLRKGIMNVGDPRPMLLHFSCERMDDNISSFVSKRPAAKAFARAYIRNYVLPMFDFHLANSAYTAAELFTAAKERKGGFMNACWGLLRAPKVPIHERVFVNACGVDSETFTADRRDPAFRSNMLADLDIRGHAKVLLYAGRLSPEKHVELLPEIMSLLAGNKETDYRLLVAGDGPLKGPLTSEFAKLAEGRVSMLGNVSDKDYLAGIYANCDAFIHPNPHEPFGIAPLEAMSAGLPLIAPNAGGVLSYADESNSWLVEPTAEKFAEAVRSVFADTSLRSERVDNARSTALRYTWERSTDELFALHDKLYAEFCGQRKLYDYAPAPTGIDFAKSFTGR